MSRITEKPLFITIGAMKSGTSSLHQYLRLHPEIHVSWVKETNHFKLPKPPPGGMLRYQALLTGPGRIVGETSPNYTKALIFPGVARRMHEAVPEARLIYILRDPVDRALSHYHHNRLHGRERRTIETAFMSDVDNNYIDTSRYYSQLEHFLCYYQKDRILVLDFAELKSNPQQVMRRVFGFVGVAPDFTHPHIGRVFHDSKSKRQPNALGRILTEIPVVRNLRYGLPWLFENPLERPVISPDLRTRLEDWLRPDAELMRNFAELPFASWSVFKTIGTKGSGDS
jgi:hypothetical protein